MECAHACRVCACVQSVRMRDFTVPSDERPGNKDDSTVPAFTISGKTSTLPTCQYSIDIFHIKTSKYSRLESRSWKSRTMLTQTPRVADIWQGAKWRPSLKADLFRKNDFPPQKVLYRLAEARGTGVASDGVMYWITSEAENIVAPIAIPFLSSYNHKTIIWKAL